MKAIKTPAAWADALVDGIAKHKATMLAFSLVATLVFAAIAGVMVFGEREGGELTRHVADVGGYVAIVGLVLGFPALGYAMVTDRAVEKLRDEMGLTDAELKTLNGEVDETIQESIQESILRSGISLPESHHVQVFVPNLQRTRLFPIFDPEDEGPEEGWSIAADTPQAITGSAWVGDTYLVGLRSNLEQPSLRLTAGQIKRYRRLTGVAAVPIRDELREGEEKRIGVLTIFTDAEQPKMVDDGFEALHLGLARAVAPVLRKYVPRVGPLEQSDLSLAGPGRAPPG